MLINTTKPVDRTMLKEQPDLEAADDRPQIRKTASAVAVQNPDLLSFALKIQKDSKTGKCNADGMAYGTQIAHRVRRNVEPGA